MFLGLKMFFINLREFLLSWLAEKQNLRLKITTTEEKTAWDREEHKGTSKLTRRFFVLN